MGKFIDLTGKKINQLMIMKRIYPNNKNNCAMWKCKCECGQEIIVCSADLIRNHTKSCGCLRIKSATKHGMSYTSTYRIWHGMIQRCYNLNYHHYKDYGGRGVKVCPEWQEPNGQGFLNFLEDMGERPSGKTLDRIDNEGDYCQKNCKWSTFKEQARNRRNNTMVTINRETKLLIELCEKLQIKYDIVLKRIEIGWSIEEALELIPRKNK